MTHDELLAKINKRIYFYDGAGIDDQIALALLAVVKLHKPNEEGFCSACFVSVVHFPYPCPTIKAIENELS